MKTILQLIALAIALLILGSVSAHIHANLAPLSPWAEMFHLTWILPTIAAAALWYSQIPTKPESIPSNGISLFGLSINPVVGSNLAPKINPGSYVIFHRFFNRKQLKIGDLVKVNHPKLGIMVKHISYIDSNGLFWLQAENNLGLSTLDMGPIRAQRIIGKTLYVINKQLEPIPRVIS